MSHVSDLKLHVRDLQALKAAAKTLGMELTEKKTFKWYGTSVGDYPLPAGFTKADMGKCEYALTITGNSRAYEVGVCKARGGKPGYVLLQDFWAGGYGLDAAIGKEGVKLKHSYAVEIAKKDMQKFQRECFRMTQTRKADGTLVVKATMG